MASGLEFQGDDEDDRLNAKYNPMFFSQKRLEEIKNKTTESFEPSEDIINNLITRWGSKRGIGGLSEISPELRAKLGTFYKDRLLDHRDTWGDEVAKKDSSGNYVISPKLTSNYLSDEDPISEEEVREKLEKSGLDIPKDVIEGYILNKETQENNSADLLIDQIYQLAPLDVTPGADKVPGFWRSGGPVGSLLGI